MMAGYQGATRTAAGSSSSVYTNSAANDPSSSSPSSSSRRFVNTFATPTLASFTTSSTSAPSNRIPYEAAPTPSGLSQLAHLLAPLPPSPGASMNNQYYQQQKQTTLHPHSNPTIPSKSPPAAGESGNGTHAQQMQASSQRNSASASQSDSGSTAGSRIEASSPLEGSEDEDEEEDEEEGDEDLVEEDAPIDWSAIDANTFFQSWFLPGGGVEERQDPGHPLVQQMSQNDFLNPPLSQPAQVFTPNGSMASSDHSFYRQQQQQQQTQPPPIAPSPNLSAAIEILTKVLGEGQEVPSQVLEMLLQSVAPTFGYQPPTPSQEPGIDSLVPILKDLIKKQQLQEQQLQAGAKVGETRSSIHDVAGSSSSCNNGQQSWTKTVKQRSSGVPSSTLPDISFASLTPQTQPFNWLPIATPADEDEEDDEDKDPSYNPVTVGGTGRGRGGELGIQDALEEQVSQYLNSPYAATPIGAPSNRPSPLPSALAQAGNNIPGNTSASASIRSSPRRAQALQTSYDETSSSRSRPFEPASMYVAPASPTPGGTVGSISRMGHRGDARKKAMEMSRSEEMVRPSPASRSDPLSSTLRGGARLSRQKRSRDGVDSESDMGEGSRPFARHYTPEDSSAPAQKAGQGSKRRSDSSTCKSRRQGDVHDDVSIEDARMCSPSRSPSPEGGNETVSPVKKPSNAGRKPVYETEEERKAKRLAQNRKNQQQWRARKRAEKQNHASIGGSKAGSQYDAGDEGAVGVAGTNSSATASATSARRAAALVQRGIVASSALLEDQHAQLRDEYEEIFQEHAELKAEQRILRTEMERLRRENLDLRVEVEIARRLRVGDRSKKHTNGTGGGIASNADAKGVSSSRSYDRRSQGTAVHADVDDRRFRSSFRRAVASDDDNDDDDDDDDEEAEAGNDGEGHDDHLLELQDRSRRRRLLSEGYSKGDEDDDDDEDRHHDPSDRRWVDKGRRNRNRGGIIVRLGNDGRRGDVITNSSKTSTTSTLPRPRPQLKGRADSSRLNDDESHRHPTASFRVRGSANRDGPRQSR